MDKKNLIDSIVQICHRMDERGFVANHDGNVSIKYNELFLVTPTSIPKYKISSDLILTLDSNMNVIEGKLKPFSELELHLAAYKARKELNAVVHCHPPFATARGLTSKELLVNIPEAVISIGRKIPVVPLLLPGDNQIESKLKEAFLISDIIMIQGNGVLSIGKDVEQAYLRCELLEHVSKIDSYAHMIGKPFELNTIQEKELLNKRRQIFSMPQSQKTIISDEFISLLISEEVEKAFSNFK